MNPEEATRLCISAIRHGCIHDKHQWVATALESGDLRIVSNHHTLMCSDKDCHENALIACSLLKKQVERLAALEKVAKAARGVRDSDQPLAEGCACDGRHGHPDYPPPRDCRAWEEKFLAQALAELDALDGGDGA